MRSCKTRPTDPKEREGSGCETRQRRLRRLLSVALLGLVLAVSAWPAYGFSTGYQKVLWVKVDDFGIWIRLANYTSPDSQCASPLDYRLAASGPLFEVKTAALLSAVLADKQIALTASTCSGPGTFDGMNVIARITVLP